MSRNKYGFYIGADTKDAFDARWRGNDMVGAHGPYMQVQVRRGRFRRFFHDDWPNPQFGRVFGRSINHQWYATWTPTDDYTDLEGIAQVQLDQNFSNNGISVATIEVDNVQWVQKLGVGGRSYHERQRGYLWPWRGWVPPHRPGSPDEPNDWFERLPNAQITIRQGYGSDTAIKTFTGLIDKLDGGVRPDRLTLTARDFGGVLSDSYMFGWNKTRTINDPIIFVPKNYEKFKWVARAAKKTNHRWIIIEDACDIVRVVLRWAGFKEWEVEQSGVNLSVPYTVDKSHTYMDVINDMATALGYQFFMAEPSRDRDDSIGVPIFRRPSVLIPERSLPITLSSQKHLTDFKPTHDNSSDRYIIRVRGVVNKKVGRTLGGDTVKRVTFNYWPPWMIRMSGVIKQLTYYDIGSNGVLGLQTVQQCMVAALLIAVQIALARDTGIAQCPGNPAFGLDSFAYVRDKSSGIFSRLYITNRTSIMALGGDGTSQTQSPYAGSGGGSSELLWSTQLGGSLVDNPEFEKVMKDYHRAISGKNVWTWGRQPLHD